MIPMWEGDPLIRALRVPDVTSYLRRAGWRPTESRYSALLAFETDLEGAPRPALVALTRNPGDPDTHRRIAEVVNTLSQIEDRSPQEVANSIADVDADVLLWRLPSDPGAGASISLDAAVGWVERLREVIAYAACAEQDARPYFSRATAIGREHAKHCRFGHTVPGSFAFRIASPVAPPVQPTLDGDSRDVPFARRVVERITRGLLAVRDAVLAGDPTPLVESYPTGLNANLCDVIRELLEQTGDSGFAYSVNWSRTWPPDKALCLQVPVQLEYRAAQFLEATGQALRQGRAPVSRVIRGRVVQLRSDSEPEVGEFEGVSPGSDGPMVTVAAATDEFRSLRVRLLLQPAEYRLACDAHRDGREVQVAGRLEKLGRFWVVTALHDFQVL